MSYYQKSVAHGVLIPEENLKQVMQSLVKPLSLEEKKRLYIGHNVLSPVKVHKMEARYQEAYASIDNDDPDFMVNDFGPSWMNYIDMYMDARYPSINLAPYLESSYPLEVMPELAYLRNQNTGIAIYLNNTRKSLPSYPHASPPTDSELEEYSNAFVITRCQRKHLERFLKDAGITDKPSAIVWEELDIRGGWRGCIRERWHHRKHR